MLARPLVLAIVVAAASAGCSRNQPGITNPFTTADRVPPPATQLAPGTAQPYYPAAPGAIGAPPTTFGAPATGQPIAPQQFAPPQGTSIAPPQAAPFNSVPPVGSTPFGATSPSPSTQLAASTPGDSVAIPGDSTALRFGPAAKPAADNPRQPTSLAARTAVNGGWVSGSAPVRSSVDPAGSVFAAAPRVRMPGAETMSREPVDVAALDARRSDGSAEAIGWR